MTPPTLDLARRAVACEGWRWLPGMRWVVARAAPLEDYGGRIHDGVRRAPDGPGLPDLSDPATLGCLLALVREAWAAPYAQASPRLTGNPTRGVGWVAYLNDDEADRRFRGETEAEALVAALEAASAAGGAR